MGSAHTPTPWFAQDCSTETQYRVEVLSLHGVPVAMLICALDDKEAVVATAADAQRIVQTANCHDSMVEALQTARAFIADTRRAGRGPTIDAIDAALFKAGVR
jgi:hypothetical protein